MAAVVVQSFFLSPAWVGQLERDVGRGGGYSAGTGPTPSPGRADAAPPGPALCGPRGASGPETPVGPPGDKGRSQWFHPTLGLRRRASRSLRYWPGPLLQYIYQ